MVNTHAAGIADIVEVATDIGGIDANVLFR